MTGAPPMMSSEMVTTLARGVQPFQPCDELLEEGRRSMVRSRGRTVQSVFSMASVAARFQRRNRGSAERMANRRSSGGQPFQRSRNRRRSVQAASTKRRFSTETSVSGRMRSSMTRLTSRRLTRATTAASRGLQHFSRGHGRSPTNKSSDVGIYIGGAPLQADPRSASRFRHPSKPPEAAPIGGSVVVASLAFLKEARERRLPGVPIQRVGGLLELDAIEQALNVASNRRLP